jgi:uncharacterized membrane protein YqgA involved in biofilm formation
MPIGIIINTLSTLIGGVLGALFGNIFSDKLKDDMTCVFGLCALGMGVASVVLMKNMPAVVLSVVLGLLIGHKLDIAGAFNKLGGLITKIIPLRSSSPAGGELMTIAIILFCFGGTGIYGSLVSGFSGDHSILISKSVLDLFTAMIIACTLGYAVCGVSVVQFAFMMLLFGLSRFIIPFVSDVMICDFKACGGFILLGTGLRMMKIKDLPVPDLLPALVIIMPLSAFYTSVVLPLLQ